MKSQLISLAKEKGFISPIIGKSVEAQYTNKDFYYLWMCELQKWLRTDWNIILLVHYSYFGTDQDPELYYYSVIDNNRKLQEGSYYMEYEKALEKGLQEILRTLPDYNTK